MSVLAQVLDAGAARQWAGTVGTPDKLAELIDLGYRFVVLGADVTAISQQCRSIIERARGLAEDVARAAGQGGCG